MEPMGAIYEPEKEIVMKNIAAVALFIASTIIAAGPASAQDHQVNANVPFNFTVGDRALPSGSYTIGTEMNSSALIGLRNWDKKVSILSLGLPDQDNRRHENVLVFHRYGNQYFLSDIRSEGSSMNIHFPTSKAEKRAKAEVEDARLSVDEPVLIALK
jgi:hypothetical protein